MSCAVMNCFHNDLGECKVEMTISESGYCETKEVDEDRCESCGTDLEETVGEPLEHFGFPCREVIRICPNCD